MFSKKFYLKLLMGLLLMAFMAPPAQADELTVANGRTTTNQYVPIYGYYWDTGFKNTVIYPASMLSDMSGGTINSITLTANSSFTALSGGTVKVSLGEVDETVATGHFSSGLTQVFSGTPTCGNSQVVITFDTPFEYNGGNLAVEFYLTTTGNNCPYIYFYGETVGYNASYNSYGSSLSNGYNGQDFLPEATFNYDAGTLEPYAASVNPAAEDCLAFGAIAVGASKTIDVTLRNKGANAFTPTVTVSGTGFSTTYTAAEIASKGSATIPVVFNPAVAGDFTGTLSINCGQAGSFTFNLTGSAANELIICDATTNQGYLPVYGTQYDNAQINQMLYPVEKLSGLSGKTLKSMTFYPVSGISFKKVPASFSLANMPAGTTAYTSSNPTRLQPAGLTPVGSIEVAETAQSDVTEWTLVFDTPFTYDGGDLLIEVTTPTGGGWGSTNFYAENLGYGNYQSYYSYGSTAQGQYWLPKVKFTFENAGPTPTITVNPTTLDAFSTEVGTAVTKTVTVTGANLTGNITVAASGTGFSVSPTTITAADAANGVQVTVTYNPSAEGTHTGTLTLTSDGAQTVTVDLNGTATPTTSPTITASANQLTMSANVGAPVTKTLTVTGANLTGNITAAISGTNASYFSVSPASLGTSGGELTVTYNPEAAGSHTATLTLSSTGAQDVTVTLNGTATVVPNYAVTVTGDEGTHVHNFGEVVVGAISNWTVTVTNNGLNAVTPTITGLAAPFTTSYVAASLAPGASAQLLFNFEPTELQEYTPQSITITFPEAGNDLDYPITLRGIGIDDTGGTKPPTFYDGISYTWTDSENVEHTSKLSDIATDPDQMIALMKEVYTNKTIPGSLYRGRKQDGSVDTNHPVAYPAIGTVVQNYTSGSGYSYSYGDTYGWGITNDENNYPIVHDTQSSSSYEYWALNPNEYTPDEDGLTLLLVEMKDGAQYNSVTTEPSDYASLRNTFDIMFKSVRVVTHSKKSGTGAEAGTLFKIDCDKMNRFFFLGKGRLRLYNSDIWNNTSASTYMRHKLSEGESHASSTQSESRPFYQMFEQFSPVSLTSSTGNATDIYQALVNMESYSVEHDCETIPFISANNANGHEFNLYGKESTSEDCQDIRDLMLFIPDYRMQWWYEAVNSSRDGVGSESASSDMFKNYNKSHMPTMGLYVINQKPITGEKKDGEDVYTLHLTWESNLLDFLPSADGTYYIYQVNDDGTYTLVGTTNANTTELYVDVAMQGHGQQVTYVIQGQDNSRFLSLQMSNEESFIIPGTDSNEIFQLVPNADNWSRFDPAQETNFYANGLEVRAYPGVETSNYAGKTLNFYRKAQGATDWTLVATATVNSAATEATVATVAATQRLQSEYKYGYQENPSSVTIATDANGYNAFGIFYDNFKASVEGNNHPGYYNYKVEVNGEAAHSNEITIRIFKTAMSTIAGTFNKTAVDNDTDHQLGVEGTSFDIDVEHSSKTEILRYDAYRWTESDDYYIIEPTSPADNEQDVAPNGIAGNQGEYYTVAMNSDYVGENVYVSQGGTSQATFEDSYPEAHPNAYVYAPVVETFTSRGDYNTYGAPLQTTATGKTELTVGEKKASNYTFQINGVDYVYYQIPLTATVTIPTGYEIYKIRAWRVIDKTAVGENFLGEIDPDFAYRADYDCLFEELSDGVVAPQGNPIGTTAVTTDDPNQVNVTTGTFGAKKLADGQSFTAQFIVRTYFTKPTRDGGDYFISQTIVDVPIDSDITTGIVNVKGEKQVAGVKYYNVAGMESDKPFSGVNIIVTRYTDGSTSTSKVLK